MPYNFIEIDKRREFDVVYVRNCGQMKTGQTSKTYSRLRASAIAPYLTYSLTKSIKLNHFLLPNMLKYQRSSFVYVIIVYIYSSHWFHFSHYRFVAIFGQVKRLFFCVFIKSGSSHEKKNANYTKESFLCVYALVFFLLHLCVEYCHAIF